MSDATLEVKTVPARSEVDPSDCWDLASLYASDADWETDFAKFEQEIEKYADFRGKLGDGPAALRACLDFDQSIDRLAERLGTYAFLKTTEDQTADAYQALMARFQNVAVKAGQIAAYMRPELLAIPKETMDAYLASDELADFRLSLERITRYRDHTLTDSEEELLA
ncbi:MAG: oligoendopeptidase F, partial [Planctomycetota bacterium]